MSTLELAAQAQQPGTDWGLLLAMFLVAVLCIVIMEKTR